MPQSVKIYQKVKKAKVSKKLMTQKGDLIKKWTEIEDTFSAFKENEIETPEKTLFVEKIDTAKRALTKFG